MRVSKSFLFLITGLLVLALLQSCKKDVPGKPSSAYPEILVLFSPDGLGDMGYNDEVLRGIELFMNEKDMDFYISFMTPTDYEIAEFLIRMWWAERNAATASDGSVPRKLLLLADSGYADIARKVMKASEINIDLSVLAFETEAPEDASEPIRTFEFSMYGASWLAAKTARALGCAHPLVLLGDGSNTTLHDGRDGFLDGFQAEVPVEALAYDWQGYCMPMEAYQQMYDYAQHHDFIFSISGGSNMGIYRYLRENPDCGVFTAGMDTDQSPYSTLIVGSLVKRIDLVLHKYLCDWYKRVEVPNHQYFGLESGYIDWSIPERYKYLRPTIDALRQEAIQKENAYEKVRN